MGLKAGLLGGGGSKKGSKKYSTQTPVKLRFQKNFYGQIPVITWVKAIFS
jgi:hypothetical protein